MSINKAWVCVVPLLLAGCLSQTDVQARYNDENQECRDYAEDNIDRFLPAGKKVSPADRNAQMVTLFSDCMGKRGWQVAKPKKAEELASTAPMPSPNNPGAFPSAASVAAPVPTTPAPSVEVPSAAMRAPSAVTTPMQSPLPVSPQVPLQPMMQPMMQPSSQGLPGWPQQTGAPPASYQPMYGLNPGQNFYTR